MIPPFRFAPYGRERLHKLARVLHQAYGAPESILGNQIDPLDEAIYIILSFQTDLPRFKETWQKLRSTFQRWTDVEQAPLDKLSAALRSGGLHRQKATAIKRLLLAVRRQFGEASLHALHEMGDAEAERTLTRLPGISWKAARCILLYSLDRKVLPIDGNSFRVLQRVGVIPFTAVYRRRSLHDAIQEAIDPELRRRFHVNLVVHGREVCLPQRPSCDACPAASFCLRRGLPFRSPVSRSSRLAAADLPISRLRMLTVRDDRSISGRSPSYHMAAAG